MLVDAFRTSIFPYLCQVGVILLVYSFCTLGYQTLRKPDMQMFIDKFKGYLFAYLLIRSAFVIVNFIDKVIDNIK
jgi:hypothetical protein